jgi:hypothetical protein
MEPPRHGAYGRGFWFQLLKPCDGVEAIGAVIAGISGVDNDRGVDIKCYWENPPRFHEFTVIMLPDADEDEVIKQTRAIIERECARQRMRRKTSHIGWLQ